MKQVSAGQKLDEKSNVKYAISEQDLLIALRNNDKRGYEILYDNYSATIFGVILKIIKHQETAEDILSETFLKISRSFHQYDASRGRFFTWIITIARHLAIDKLRSKEFVQRVKTVELDSQISYIEHKQPLSINPAEADVKLVTSRLAPQQKLLIDMAFFQGYTHSEISKELNMPLGTVKSHIRKAISALREVYNFNTTSSLSA